MLAEAAGFALLAAISPTALLVMAVFLNSAEPRRNALMYTTGAVVMTVAAAVAALFAYLAASAATTDMLARCNGWLRAHGRQVLGWALTICGLALVVNGALGLAGVL